MLHFLYATGLRLAEIIQAKVGDLNWVEYPADAEDDEPVAGWLLRVVGKRNKAREVPVSVAVVEELSTYLGSRGLHPDPAHASNHEVFLLGKAKHAAEPAPWAMQSLGTIDGRDGIAAATLYDQLKGFFMGCAKVLAVTDAKGAARLAKASTHWCRHTYGSHAVASGTPVDVLQQNLGHASLSTTTIYITSEQKRRMKAMKKFWAGSRKSNADLWISMYAFWRNDCGRAYAGGCNGRERKH